MLESLLEMNLWFLFRGMHAFVVFSEGFLFEKKKDTFIPIEFMRLVYLPASGWFYNTCR